MLKKISLFAFAALLIFGLSTYLEVQAPWGTDLLNKAPVTSSSGKSVVAHTPAPRLAVPRKSSGDLAALVGDPVDQRVLLRIRASIKAGRNLPELETLLREALAQRPRFLELNELIGDIYFQEGRMKEALERYENSETSENEFSLTPKLIRLYGEVVNGDAVDKYLTRMDKNIVERATYKNQSAEQVEAREQAALAVCKARYLRKLENADSEANAYAVFNGCKQHFAKSHPGFLKRYRTYEPDAAAWARDISPR